MPIFHLPVSLDENVCMCLEYRDKLLVVCNFLSLEYTATSLVNNAMSKLCKMN